MYHTGTKEYKHHILKTHPFDCPIHKAPHPTDALSAVKFLMANHTGAAHAGGPVLPNFFIISPCQAPIPLASAVPAATARQVFRVADLDLCGGKVTSSGYFSHLVRATNSAAVATQEVFVPRADPQLSERPERGLRTGGGACSKKRRQTLLAAPCHASKAGRAWTKRYQRGATKNSAKSEEAGRRRRRAANDEAGGRSAEEVVRTRRAQLRRGGVADERAATSRWAQWRRGGARGAEVARKAGGRSGETSEAASPTTKIGRQRRQRGGARAKGGRSGGTSAVAMRWCAVATRWCAEGGRAQRRDQRGGVADNEDRAATSRWAQRRGGGGRRAQRQRGGARAEGGRSGGTSAVAMRWCAVATG
ncbi:hypothetical protein C8R47DRAFT_1075288, partial [Mycena vitilis]